MAAVFSLLWLALTILWLCTFVSSTRVFFARKGFRYRRMRWATGIAAIIALAISTALAPREKPSAPEPETVSSSAPVTGESAEQLAQNQMDGYARRLVAVCQPNVFSHELIQLIEDKDVRMAKCMECGAAALLPPPTADKNGLSTWSQEINSIARAGLALAGYQPDQIEPLLNKREPAFDKEASTTMSSVS
jgi:ferredoxin-like protein FixX